MTIYEKELSQLKPSDEIQFTSERYSGYDFITTAGHGYLVVPRDDNNYQKALRICEYGFKGFNACYLEEDCEFPEFIEAIA